MKYSLVDCLRNKPGKVKVEFFMKQDGLIKDLEVLESYSPKFDRMILDILNDMPKWNPGNSRSSSTILFHLTVSFTTNKKLFKPAHMEIDLEDFALLSIYPSRFWLKESLLDLVKRGKVITCMPVSIIEMK